MDVAKTSVLETNTSLLHDYHKEAEQRATADAAAFYNSTLTALQAEATTRAKADALSVAELKIAQFKYQLRIDIETRKENARIAVATPAASVSRTRTSGKSK
jgi:hypothetical protein